MRKPAAQTILIFLLVTAPFILQTANHEYVHVYFAEEHNCENIQIHGPNLKQNSAASVTYNPSTCKNPELLNLKQEMVEAVGYQKITMMFLNVLIILLVVDTRLQLNK